MKLVDLFCGCGGFSRGAHLAGFDVAAAYDIDPVLTSSYSRNFPQTKLVLRDVSELTGAEITADVGGEVFGVFGGPPCQGFSDIGRRDVNDPRRKLLSHFFRLVAELNPTFFVMENVRGLMYKDSRPVLDRALESVRQAYDLIGPHIWDAADFGAATSRRRMFVVGIRKDVRARFDISMIDKHRSAPTTVSQAIADLVDAEQLEPCASLPDFDRWRASDRHIVSAYALTLRSPDRVFTGNKATEHSAAVISRFARIAPGAMEKIGRHPRLHPEGQCPTLRAGTGSDKGSYQSVRPIHYELDRVITVREGARLQGFPDAHIFHPSVWHSFRMIGNSVSPVIAHAIFKALKAAVTKPAASSSSSRKYGPGSERQLENLMTA
ncbi:DNA cytosine methyltransferase [Tianweitania sediminis]|uniref:DNA (cytosine-5-)-methyltransferase n=1 Tax=Tianweitania sediminis TaxID=1502156 RepID=A0A8J7UKC8_9HYPH|nr:DNA cytosine methyltransferase [Tianweitania sediminis]MBP0439559.1 DNA cytosine methyltransferase [Tianweitania sediminis]